MIDKGRAVRGFAHGGIKVSGTGHEKICNYHYKRDHHGHHNDIRGPLFCI